jgi:acetyltransferase-like isoleucine patch superfamily enzyme
MHILDRSLLEIGNRVVLGRNVEFSSHLTRRKGDALRLLVRKIRIGNSCFVGEGARLGPGATVASGETVPAGAALGADDVIGD